MAAPSVAPRARGRGMADVGWMRGARTATGVAVLVLVGVLSAVGAAHTIGSLVGDTAHDELARYLDGEVTSVHDPAGFDLAFPHQPSRGTTKFTLLSGSVTGSRLSAETDQGVTFSASWVDLSAAQDPAAAGLLLQAVIASVAASDHGRVAELTDPPPAAKTPYRDAEIQRIDHRRVVSYASTRALMVGARVYVLQVTSGVRRTGAFTTFVGSLHTN